MRPKNFAMLLLLCLGGCYVDWANLVNTDHTRPDTNPPAVQPAVDFRLLIVEETSKRPGLPAAQQSIFASTKLHKYLREHCATLPDGSQGWRVTDMDYVKTLPAVFQAPVDAHPPKSLPWLYCTGGGEGISAPLPESVDALMAKITPYVEGK